METPTTTTAELQLQLAGLGDVKEDRLLVTFTLTEDLMDEWDGAHMDDNLGEPILVAGTYTWDGVECETHGTVHVIRQEDGQLWELNAGDLPLTWTDDEGYVQD